MGATTLLMWLNLSPIAISSLPLSCPLMLCIPNPLLEISPKGASALAFQGIQELSRAPPPSPSTATALARVKRAPVWAKGTFSPSLLTRSVCAGINQEGTAPPLPGWGWETHLQLQKHREEKVEFQKLVLLCPGVSPSRCLLKRNRAALSGGKQPGSRRPAGHPGHHSPECSSPFVGCRKSPVFIYLLPL